MEEYYGYNRYSPQPVYVRAVCVFEMLAIHFVFYLWLTIFNS